MYPRNAASPPRIAVGQVVQISDGAIQSSGVSVVVRPQGGAESAGGGTIEYSAASNVVYYTPTQAETNYESFVVIAYKASCFAAEKTIVTTASNVAGKADVGAWNGTALSTTNPLPNAAAGSNNGLPTVDGNNRIAGIQGTITTLDALDTAQDTQHQSTVNLIGSGGANLTAVPWNAAWDAEVQSEVNDGLIAFWTSPATLVDLIWDEATSGHTTAGTTGKALTDAGSAGDPWSTSLPGAYGAGTAGYIVGTNLDATVSSRNSTTPPTTGAIADAVWDETLADHLTAGSTGASLNAAGSAGDPWTTTLPGSYTGSQAGKILADILVDTGTTLDGKLDTIDGIVDSILEDTGTTIPALFPSNFAALGINVSGHLSRVTLVDTTTTNTDMRGTDSAYTGTPPTTGQIADAVWTEPWAGQTSNVLHWGGLLYQFLDNIQTYTGTDIPATITTIDGVADAIKLVTDKLDTALEADGATGYQYTTLALENAPAGGGGGGDATEANQTTIIGHLTDIKGATFSGSTDSLEAIRDRGDVAWVTGGGGSGLYTLNVTVADSDGDALAGARVNIDGTSQTLTTPTNGVVSFNVDSGDYTLVVSPPAGYQTPSNTDITISADASTTITLTAGSSGVGWLG